MKSNQKNVGPFDPHENNVVDESKSNYGYRTLLFYMCFMPGGQILGHYYPSSRVKGCINKIKEFEWLIAGLYWPI